MIAVNPWMMCAVNSAVSQPGRRPLSWKRSPIPILAPDFRTPQQRGKVTLTDAGTSEINDELYLQAPRNSFNDSGEV